MASVQCHHNLICVGIRLNYKSDNIFGLLLNMPESIRHVNMRSSHLSSSQPSRLAVDLHNTHFLPFWRYSNQASQILVQLSRLYTSTIVNCSSLGTVVGLFSMQFYSSLFLLSISSSLFLSLSRYLPLSLQQRWALNLN